MSHVSTKPPRSEIPFGSNAVRLTPRQCVIAGVLMGAIFYLVPTVWTMFEPLDIGPDHRVPYSLGSDYWNYRRTCRAVATADRTLLVGDSVIWGHYVASDETLSHDLNTLTGSERFANLGLDGVHPVALCGLIEHYGTVIRGRDVILNCNLLWLTSPRYDLSADKPAPFNHPALVPQFEPWIPCYRAPLAERLGIVISRKLDFLAWADHVRIAYFGGSDLATWTLEQPYANPLAQVTGQLPSPDEPPSPPPDLRPWYDQGIEPNTPEWVELDASLQWQFFRRTVAILRDRGNRVFVLVGPFNEHTLTPAGLQAYTKLQTQIAGWLEQQRIPHFVPPALPSDLYHDTSHPNAAGYRLLAEQLLAEREFAGFLAEE